MRRSSPVSRPGPAGDLRSALTPAAVRRVFEAAGAPGETVAGVVCTGAGLLVGAAGVVPVAACRGRGGDTEQLSDLVPGQLLVPDVGDGIGYERRFRRVLGGARSGVSATAWK